MTVDVRVLSGTHKDLKEQVAEGLFRRICYYAERSPIESPASGGPEDFRAANSCASVCEKSNIKDNHRRRGLVGLKATLAGNVRNAERHGGSDYMSGDRVSCSIFRRRSWRHRRDRQPARSSASENLGQVRASFILTTLRRNLGNISQSAIELGSAQLPAPTARVLALQKEWFPELMRRLFGLAIRNNCSRSCTPHHASAPLLG